MQIEDMRSTFFFTAVGVVHEMFCKTDSVSSNKKQRCMKHVRACWLTTLQGHDVTNEQGCPPISCSCHLVLCFNMRTL
jgi:hypothetical protein